MANQNHALVTSTPFTLICSYQVPTTKLDPDFVSSIWFCVGEFETLEEAKSACYSFTDHPAHIAMQVNQNLRYVAEEK